MSSVPHIEGVVAPGFDEVRREFARNFIERGEIGAAVAAYWRGEKVVDLWGGRRTPDTGDLWNEDTMVAVASTTKGLAAMTLAIARLRRVLSSALPGAFRFSTIRPSAMSDVMGMMIPHKSSGTISNVQTT